MWQGLLDSFGKQPGDPARVALAVIRAVEEGDSPFRLSLGKAAVMYAKQRSQELYRDAIAWEEISNGVDYAEGQEENFWTYLRQILGDQIAEALRAR